MPLTDGKTGAQLLVEWEDPQGEEFQVHLQRDGYGRIRLDLKQRRHGKCIEAVLPDDIAAELAAWFRQYGPRERGRGMLGSE